MPDSTTLAGNSIDPSPVGALRRAVAIIGGQSKTARLLDLSQTSIWKWVSKGKVLPAEHVLTIEAATGISRHDLRPDIYPIDLSPAPAPEAASSASDSRGPTIPDGRTPSHLEADLVPGSATCPVAGGEAAQSSNDPGCAADTPPIGKAAA